MKQTATKPFATRGSAPALSRGLTLLHTLNQAPPYSLEALSARLNIPKASALRLLETLEANGLVHRRADKRYEPLYSLQPVGDLAANFRNTLQPQMAELSQRLGHTIEWYEPTDTGMMLVLQSVPQTEVQVVARPGFLRDWFTEHEAVTRLGFAYAKQAPTVQASQTYISNGKRHNLSNTEALAQVKAAKASGKTYDKAYNTNGVRRAAIAALQPRDRFHGVLAVAEAHRFDQRPSPLQLLKELESILP